MAPLEFMKDRAIFFGSLAVYHVWKQTVGQEYWNGMISRFEDFDLFVYGMLLVAFVMYIVTSGMFAFLDLVIAPIGITPGERLQPQKTHTLNQYRKAIPLVLLNSVVVGYPTILSICYFLHPASPRSATGSSSMYPDLPPVPIVLRDILSFMALREMIFYHLHRLLHHPALYATFHKKHHEFTAPIAISALYAHPVDFILTNVIPLLIGPLILNSHPVTVWIYFSEAVIETISVHSGYNCPGFPNAAMHDFHHETFNGMFGLLGLGDYLHGTDANFFRHGMHNPK